MLQPLPPDPYKALGVTRSTQPSDIKKAYRTLALKCHPDKTASDDSDVKAKKNEEFQAIQQAYETLMDEGKRREYEILLEKHRRFEQDRHMFPPPPMANMGVPRYHATTVHVEPRMHHRSVPKYTSPPDVPEDYVFVDAGGLNREKKSSRREKERERDRRSEKDQRSYEEWLEQDRRRERKERETTPRSSDRKEKSRDRKHHSKEHIPSVAIPVEVVPPPSRKSTSRKHRSHSREASRDRSLDRSPPPSRRHERSPPPERRKERRRRTESPAMITSETDGEGGAPVQAQIHKLNEAQIHMRKSGTIPGTRSSPPKPEYFTRVKSSGGPPPAAPTPPPPTASAHPPPQTPPRTMYMHDDDEEEGIPRSSGSRRGSRGMSSRSREHISRDDHDDFAEPIYTSIPRAQTFHASSPPRPSGPMPRVSRAQTFHEAPSSSKTMPAAPHPPRRSETYDASKGRHRSRQHSSLQHEVFMDSFDEEEDEADDRRRFHKAQERSHGPKSRKHSSYEDIPIRPKMSREHSSRSRREYQVHTSSGDNVSYRHVTAVPMTSGGAAYFHKLKVGPQYTTDSVHYSQYESSSIPA